MSVVFGCFGLMALSKILRTIVALVIVFRCRKEDLAAIATALAPWWGRNSRT
jgi:hypothetical protein